MGRRARPHPIEGSTAPCPCGAVGCLGAVAGGTGLAATAEELARTRRSAPLAERRRQRGALTAADLGVAVGEGDTAAAEAIRRAGTSVGTVLAGLVSFCNPSLIVLGGEVTKVGDLLLAAIREAVYSRSLPLSTRHLTITSWALGEDAPLVGGAALAIGELYGVVPLLAGD